jgi:hypothetical protein
VTISLATAQHEAAHVVVGLHLGLSLREASAMRGVCPDGAVVEGYVWFPRGPSSALALMYAAGPAWERATGGLEAHERADVEAIRGLGLGRGTTALVRAAGAILTVHAPLHARVTRLLLERGRLTAADGRALVRGDWRERDE